MRSSGSVIPLFDRWLHHSSVPTKVRKAAARSGGPGRPQGRRDVALPWTGARTAARFHSLGLVAWIAFATWSAGCAYAQNVFVESPPSSHRDHSLAGGPFAAYVSEASRRFGIPERWINAVLRIESGGDVRAISRKGAMSLMQIMPQTWSELRLRYQLGPDPFAPRDYILAGAAYLRELYDRYGSPGFLAAYNAGPARYDEHLSGRPLPAETQVYVATLAPLIAGQGPADTLPVAAARTRPWTEASLFAARIERAATADLLTPLGRWNGSSTADPVHQIATVIPRSEGLFVERSRAGVSR